ncbi:MAG TPA: biotin/lipoyl-binding protein, partial [Megamonas hypermegale]|nr:biotin/lipoyl-binding protein [Megamonas hypermegale]
METDITEKIKPVIRYSLPLILVIAAVLVFGIFKWNEAKSVLDIPDAKLTSSVVHVSSQSDGTLTEILVNDGDKVEAGQVIAKVKVITTPQQIEALQKACDEAQANYDNLEQQIKNSVTSQTVVSAAPSTGDIAAAQARVDAAAAQAQKMSKLYSIGAVSATQYTEAQSEYSAAQAALSAASAPRQVTQEVSSAPSKELSEALASAQVQLEQAQAALKQAQSDENYADITAPVSGIVYLTNFKQGDSLKENDVLLNIGNTKN